MHGTIRSGMSSIMDLVRPELFELCALELEKLPYLNLNLIGREWLELSALYLKTVMFDFVYTLSSAKFI